MNCHDAAHTRQTAEVALQSRRRGGTPFEAQSCSEAALAQSLWPGLQFWIFSERYIRACPIHTPGDRVRAWQSTNLSISCCVLFKRSEIRHIIFLRPQHWFCCEIAQRKDLLTIGKGLDMGCRWIGRVGKGVRGVP